MQLSEFNQLCREYEILLLDNIENIERASEIHANLKLQGTPVEDADIQIAATAIIRGLILVSNESDMRGIPDITVENWLRAEA